MGSPHLNHRENVIGSTNYGTSTLSKLTVLSGESGDVASWEQIRGLLPYHDWIVIQVHRKLSAGNPCIKGRVSFKWIVTFLSLCRMAHYPPSSEIIPLLETSPWIQAVQGDAPLTFDSEHPHRYQLTDQETFFSPTSLPAPDVFHCELFVVFCSHKRLLKTFEPQQASSTHQIVTLVTMPVQS